MIYHSVMIPTRHRPELLRKAVLALLETAAEPTQMEVLICRDEDDPGTEVCSYSGSVFWHTLPNTHIRDKYNALEKLARGRMLYYWSDDVFMQTQAWDLTMRLFYQNHRHKKFICSVKDDIWNGCMDLNRPAGPFCLTREWVSAVGHSINPKLKWQAIDLWLWDVGRRANLLARPDDATGRTGGYREYMGMVHAHHAHHERGKDATDAAAAPDYEPAVKGIYDTTAGENERQEEAQRLLED